MVTYRLIQAAFGIKRVDIIFGDDDKSRVDIAGYVNGPRGITGNFGTVIIVINQLKSQVGKGFPFLTEGRINRSGFKVLNLRGVGIHTTIPLRSRCSRR